MNYFYYNPLMSCAPNDLRQFKQQASLLSCVSWLEETLPSPFEDGSVFHQLLAQLTAEDTLYLISLRQVVGTPTHFLTLSRLLAACECELVSLSEPWFQSATLPTALPWIEWCTGLGEPPLLSKVQPRILSKEKRQAALSLAYHLCLHEGYSVTQAATQVGMSRATLYRQLPKFQEANGFASSMES